jgi:hypothetical protein
LFTLLLSVTFLDKKNIKESNNKEDKGVVGVVRVVKVHIAMETDK